MLGLNYGMLDLVLVMTSNHPGLKNASRAQGAMEVSLVYIFKRRPTSIQYEKYCPNF